MLVVRLLLGRVAVVLARLLDRGPVPGVCANWDSQEFQHTLSRTQWLRFVGASWPPFPLAEPALLIVVWSDEGG